jgi:hypothetical protein
MMVRLLPFLVVLFWNVLPAADASAELIYVDAQADYLGSAGQVATVIPQGTTVHADLVLDIAPGLYNENPAVGAQGTFSWENGGLQIFHIIDGQTQGAISTGRITFNFSGTGPTISGVTADQFHVVFDVGANPFQSSLDLADLIAGASVDYLRVGARIGSATSFDNIDGNVSSIVQTEPFQTVPEPTSLVVWSTLFTIGAAVVALRRTKFTRD